MEIERAEWPAPMRVAFRFGFVLLTLSALKMLACFFPLPPLFVPYWRVCGWVVTKLSPLVFHVTPIGTLQGSDSQRAWMIELWTLTLAIVAALVWTLAARATEYRRLFDRQRTFVRYSLSCAMLAYGMSKVLLRQFWTPTPTDLIQTFAGSSPFALIWRTTGYSAPYQLFGGVLEVAGAVLLLWRRTTTLGALILAGVLANVVMLNFCYQIPVKDFSSELWLQSVWLLLPQAGRLLRAILARDVPPAAALRPFPLSRVRERVRLVVKATWLLGWLGLLLFQARGVWHQRATAAKPALWGAYDVEAFTIGGVDEPATTGKRWRQVAFGATWGPAFAFVTDDNQYHLYDLTHDREHATIRLDDFDGDETAKPETLAVHTIDATHLELDGAVHGARIHARLRQRDLSQATLTHRFHWIDDGGFWR